MSDVTITLQPWDHYPRAFSIWDLEQHGAVVSDTLSSGSWTVEDGHEIVIQWGGWFNASHHHEGGDIYRFNTSDCNEGTLDIGYVPFPGKQDSIVVSCIETVGTTTPPPSTTVTSPPTTAPEPTPTTAPTTTVTSAPMPTTAPTEAPPATLAPPPPEVEQVSATTPAPIENGNLPGKINCTFYYNQHVDHIPSTDPRYRDELDNGGVPGVACENPPYCTTNCGVASADILPHTGINEYVIPVGSSLLLSGIIIFAVSRRLTRTRRAKRYVNRVIGD